MGHGALPSPHYATGACRLHVVPLDVVNKRLHSQPVQCVQWRLLREHSLRDAINFPTHRFGKWLADIRPVHLVLDLARRTVGSGGLLGGKDALIYSIKAARSLGSTRSPHLTILSTSFVQLFSLKRCWRIIFASWHSVQAVCTLA